MDIRINSNICDKNNISKSLVFYLGALYWNNPNDIEINKLISQKYIYVTQSNQYRITQKGADLFEKILIDSKSTTTQNHIDDLSQIAKEIRSLFPTGMKCDDKNKPKWSWRCSEKEALERLKKVETIYDCVLDKQEVIDAVKLYIRLYSGDKFMKIMPYFILKDGKSEMYDYIEMLKDGVDVTTLKPSATDEISELVL